jgi:hypothetical protein
VKGESRACQPSSALASKRRCQARSLPNAGQLPDLEETRIFQCGGNGSSRICLYGFRQAFSSVWIGREEERGEEQRRGAEERRGFTCLELGPGDSISSALIARSFGASHTWLVDVGSFATSDVNRYRDLATYLRQQGLPVTDISAAQNFDQLLSLWSGTYLVEGLKSLREIPSASVDFVFSHASLQQVRRSEFLPVIQELRRIQKPDGIGSHSVSMRDLIGGAANDLRFSTRAWESQLMAHAGFYTNRLRYSQMLGIFKEVGFQIEVTHVGKWDHLPIPRQKLALEFRKFSDDDLLTYEWDVLLR